ncbi:MAG: hypothetical protein ACOX3G_05005 [Armatimonadota bacterium]|jgi:hypothetical protein
MPPVVNKFRSPISNISVARNKRGSLLLAVAGAAFVIISLSVILLGMTSAAIRSNNRQQLRSSALQVAESGAERGVLWLRDQALPPISDQNITSQIGLAPAGSWTVNIVCDPDNGRVFLKTYEILATGTVSGHVRRVQVVVRQSTFGKYAYFTDRETSTSGSAIWWASNDRVDGPVHSNNTGGTNFNIDYNGWSSTRRPIFLDQVTASGTTINYNPRRPSSESDYQKVFLNGSRGYLLGIQKINLPPSTEDQKKAAWGSDIGYPTKDGVYLRANTVDGVDTGGLYIRGDAAITMSVDVSGNQVVTITQGSGRTQKTATVIFNKSNGTSTASGTALGQGSPTSANSFSNGVIYCTGNITSLSGTVADNSYSAGKITRRSAWTIATDTLAKKSITITDDLVYKTRPNKDLPSGHATNLAAGTLGLVAQDINIADDGTSKHNHPNREIDAVLLAGSDSVNGSISVNNYNQGNTGTLKVIGGLIQSTRGAVGTISGGTVKTGYAKDYNYDPRLAIAPPPFYPTTGQYDRLSWKVLPD